MSDRYFHFTLGPVQGFVAQARRTRDFWAGSFILSWLSGVAVIATQKQEGTEILFPKVDEDYLSWIKGNRKGEKPVQGSIPNRFKARVPAEFGAKQAEQVIDSVNKAWKALADEVYNNDIKAVVEDGYSKTLEIWKRQRDNFWEISWAISDEKADSSILDRRKNWRSYQPPKESGVKCMMMDGWQELSGLESPNKEKSKEFWEKIRKNIELKAIKSDLYEGESLCAIAFIKRRFAHYFKDIKNVQMAGDWKLHGWEVKNGVPSVSYLAAVHWLENILIKAQKDEKVKKQLNYFQDEAHKLTKTYGEWDSHITCIDKLIYDRDSKRWSALDGNVYFENILENKNIYSDEKQAKKVVELFKKFKGEKPSPFYAVLMMDGDSLGEKMSVPENQTIISEALNCFTKAVPVIVREKNGFLIYAGGDDVLAILPLEDALNCAIALKEKYLSCFNGEIDTTLSGAIEYAHIKMPLTKVLQDAHDFLDNIAKEKTGRDAIAVRVWKPGGKALEWAQPWEIALKTNALQTLIETFKDVNKKDSSFTNRFFYKIRERFDLLNPEEKSIEDSLLDEEKKSLKKPILTKEEAISLMAMEYLNSAQSSSTLKEKTMDQAREIVEPLLEQCRPHHREKLDNEKGFTIKHSRFLHADGALLIRFLAQKGVKS